MKKLLILGGGKNQLPLIEAANDLQYYTIVCDRTDTNPGNLICSKHYKVDYMNYEVVLNIAINERIDGVISNSEPAMINVARISEKMELVGNSEESVMSLLSKEKFREIQKRANVFYPRFNRVCNYDDLFNSVSRMKYPIIVKPHRNSGSRGTTRIDCYDEEEISKAFDLCKKISFDNSVSIEEYVEMNSLCVIEADIFVIKHEIMWDGVFLTKRAEDKPMIPMTYIFPHLLEEKELEKFKETVERIINESGIVFGELNVEGYLTNDGQIFVIEINPRQGGNHIPLLIRESREVDYCKLLVSTAINDYSYYNTLRRTTRKQTFRLLHVVFSRKSGVYQGLKIDDSILKNVMWIDEKVNKGDRVKSFENATDSIACVDLKFDNFKDQYVVFTNIENLINPIVI